MRKGMLRAALLAVSMALPMVVSAPAFAVQPEEMLADPALEARARDLSKDLRCLVCQNQSIDDSNATLARDLRVLVRERLAAGDSDQEVVDYLTARYGDYVLLKPPFKASTYLLWLAPAAVLLVGGAVVLLGYRNRRKAVPETAPLSAEEQRRLDRLLDDK